MITLGNKPSTQKARGIHILKQKLRSGLDYNQILRAIILPPSVIPPGVAYPVFARPCPRLPRHGFVESRIVHNEEQLRALWDTVKKEDNSAEIVLMPFIQGCYSAVLTPTQITYGLGNDGATRGKDVQTIYFDAPVEIYAQGILKEAGVHTNPFFEIVFSKDTEYGNVVQLRDGPTLPQSTDYIPLPIVVKYIFSPSGHSYQSWERLIRIVAKMDGAVVIGTSLSSHYGVQAICRGIAVVNSRQVKIGDKLNRNFIEPNYKAIAHCLALSLQHYNKMYKYLVDKVKFSYGDCQELLVLSALATLSWAIFHNQNCPPSLLATSIITTVRLIAIAGIGESRHCCGTGPKTRYKYIYGNRRGYIDRDYVYKRALKFSTSTILKELSYLSSIFGTGVFPEQCGGKTWKNAMVVASHLERAIKNYITCPTSTRYRRLLLHWGAAINILHNGGRLIYKFNHSSLLDSVNCPVQAWKIYTHMLTPALLYNYDYIMTGESDRCIAKL